MKTTKKEITILSEIEVEKVSGGRSISQIITDWIKGVIDGFRHLT